uniref:hypothetical protein n=1 Tax=Alistipes sp. TaxID=1872444 RepID=UPI004055E663
MKASFQTTSANANNLRLQQSHCGHLSTAATVRISVVGKKGGCVERDSSVSSGVVE